MKKTAIVTDSNSGITQAEGAKLGMFVVPMPFLVNGEQFYEDINLTQDEFGRQLGVTRGVITNIEFNKTSPKPLLVDLICKVFCVNKEWVETGAGEIFVKRSPDEELDTIFTEIGASDDRVIKAIIKAYWKLPNEEKDIVRRLIDEIVAEISPR